MAYIDKIFKDYLIDVKGEDFANKFSDAEIEEARCATCDILSKMPHKHYEKGTVKNIFINYCELMVSNN